MEVPVEKVNRYSLLEVLEGGDDGLKDHAIIVSLIEKILFSDKSRKQKRFKKRLNDYLPEGVGMHKMIDPNNPFDLYVYIGDGSKFIYVGCYGPGRPPLRLIRCGEYSKKKYKKPKLKLIK